MIGPARAGSRTATLSTRIADELADGGPVGRAREVDVLPRLALGQVPGGWATASSTASTIIPAPMTYGNTRGPMDRRSPRSARARR